MDVVNDVLIVLSAELLNVRVLFPFDYCVYSMLNFVKSRLERMIQSSL